MEPAPGVRRRPVTALPRLATVNEPLRAKSKPSATRQRPAAGRGGGAGPIEARDAGPRPFTWVRPVTVALAP